MFDLGVERALIGVTLVNPTEAAAATTALTPGDFYGVEHVSLWAALADVVAEIGAADEPLVRHRAIAYGLDETAVDRIILDCLTAPGAPSRAPHYIATLRALAARRTMVLAAAELQQAAVAGDDESALRAVARLNETKTTSTTEVTFVDWLSVFAGAADGEVAIVDGFLFPGRWTSVVAPAKQGKSDWSLIVGHSLARGLDPIGETVGRPPMTVLYLDSENGRLDVVERLVRAELTPTDLARFHYSDIPDPLNTAAGAAKLLAAVRKHQAAVVILDGINGFVTGDENDAGTWIDLYNHAIAPLKAMGVAILTNDNQGRDKRDGGRGSTAKIDKTDLLFVFSRTDDGAKLERTHARTGLAAKEITMRLLGLDGTEALRYVPAGGSWPDGTARVASVLDDLGLDLDVSHRAARAAMKLAGERVANEVLAAALKWRKSLRNTLRNTSYPQAAEQRPVFRGGSVPRASDQGLNVAEHSAEHCGTAAAGLAEHSPPLEGGTFPPAAPRGVGDQGPVDNFIDPWEDF